MFLRRFVVNKTDSPKSIACRGELIFLFESKKFSSLRSRWIKPFLWHITINVTKYPHVVMQILHDKLLVRRLHQVIQLWDHIPCGSSRHREPAVRVHIACGQVLAEILGRVLTLGIATERLDREHIGFFLTKFHFLIVLIEFTGCSVICEYTSSVSLSACMVMLWTWHSSCDGRLG